jgi:thiamine transporter
LDRNASDLVRKANFFAKTALTHDKKGYDSTFTQILRGKRRMKQNKTLFLVEIAIFTALALLLSLVSELMPLKVWPQGGSVSIEMVPIFIMAYRWGVKGGVLAGFLLGLLQFVFGPKIYHPVQGFIDYFVAFSVVGLAGLFASQIKNAVQQKQRGKWIVLATLGILLGSLLRFISHFITGIVFFGSYAPEGQPVALYSFIYNGTYMLPNFILCAIIVVLVISAAPKKMI